MGIPDKKPEVDNHRQGSMGKGTNEFWLSPQTPLRSGAGL